MSFFHSSAEHLKTLLSVRPNIGIAVAEVALTKAECRDVVGSATLKAMSKLSYATPIVKVRNDFRRLSLASLDKDLIAEWIDDRLIDTPACERSSSAFSGTAAE